MLAEKKRKMLWSPNPCGNLWSKDTNKFGQKMLEKFGWTPGKGLGVNEQGIVDPIRVKTNSTQKGFGYERNNKLEVFQHQDEFSSILSDLNTVNNSSDTKETCLSLEQKSKNCKTRVHYHKFTRGKDLSRYSEKDLSCILGFASSFEEKVVTACQNMENSKDKESNDGLEMNELCFKNYHLDLWSEQISSQNETIGKQTVKKKKKRKHEILVDNELIGNDNCESINKRDEKIVEEDEYLTKKKKRKSGKNSPEEYPLESHQVDEKPEGSKISRNPVDDHPAFDPSGKRLKKKKKHKKNKSNTNQ